MDSSFAFTIDPCWGAPLDEYLEPIEHFSLRKYPVDRVLSAIKTITTNEPPETISDATLEAVLSVAYYPEHLMLLEVDFCPPLYDILGTYLDRYKLLARSFGVLLIQVHGIFSMVEFLALHDRLATFVESLALSPTRGADVFHLLSRQVVQITGLDQNSSMATAAKCLASLSSSLQGSRWRSFLLSSILLEYTFNARAEFSKAYSQIPGFGWPLVLMKMWPKLQSNLKDPKAGEERYKAMEQLAQLRDLAGRYLLVAPLHERCVVAALAAGLDCTGGDIWVEDPFMEPKDSRDFEGITSTLLRQLSTRPAENIIAGLRHLDTMSEYTFNLVRMVERYDVYPRLLIAAYARLWVEVTCDPRDRYPVDDIAYFGLSCLRYACEGCSMSGMTFGSGDSSALNVAMSLSRVDFFNLIARLFLSYAAGGDESGRTSADEFVSEGHNQLFVLSLPIAKYTEALSPAFRPYYFDWLKVFRYISQLPSMALPSSQLLLPHLEQLTSAWLYMGKAVRYSDEHAPPPCSYARCPGFKVVGYQKFARGGCLHTAYCTPRCQQADLTHGDNPHSERCGKCSVTTGLTEEA